MANSPHSLADHVLTTFFDLWPTLSRDPAELARRLARRASLMLARPPRAYCIPLRSNDTRLNPRNLSIVLSTDYDARRSHTVLLYGEDLRPLLEPVQLDPAGEDWLTVAQKLGTHENNLRYLMQKGFFDQRKIHLYQGKSGPATPILTYHGLLDPCSRSFLPPDPIWGCPIATRASALPLDFAQEIQREPQIASTRWGIDFIGWQWRCPLCYQLTDRVYYPMRVPCVEDYLNLHIPHRPPAPKPLFACATCHGVTHLSRADRDSWNVFVTYLTQGLLRGTDVEQPTWWHRRKNKPSTRPNARPAVRRYEVRDYLIDTDLTRDQIAQKMKISRATINMHVEDLYREYNVRCRDDLRKRVAMTEQMDTGAPTLKLTEKIA